MVRSYRNSSRSSVARETAQRIGKKKLRIAAKIDELAKECNNAAHVLKHCIQRAVLHIMYCEAPPREQLLKKANTIQQRKPQTPTLPRGHLYVPIISNCMGYLYSSLLSREPERERESEREVNNKQNRSLCACK